MQPQAMIRGSAVIAVGLLGLLASSVCAESSTLRVVEAFSEQPLSVGRVHFEIKNPSGVSHAEARFNVSGDHRRVLFPVFRADSVPTVADGPVGSPSGFEVLFLFAGNDPVKLIATTNLDSEKFEEYRAMITPVPADGVRSRSLISTWWASYQATLLEAQQRDDHYTVIENYLSWFLPDYLGLADSEVTRSDLARPLTSRPLQHFAEVERLLDLLTGTESIRVALQRETLLESGQQNQQATVPLPEGIRVPPVDFGEIAEDVPVEPLASLVPEDCLYVRFVRYSKFREIGRRLEVLGGSLHDLILSRSSDAGVRELLTTQLAIEETALGKLLGDVVIGEMALIAQDTFVREGSALGILFEVKNEAAFQTALVGFRSRAVERSKSWPTGAASSSRIEVSGQTVDFLSSPGNVIRSFHVSHGRYHLVTNAEHLVRGFLSCAGTDGQGSLAREIGFRHARQLYPIAEEEDAFVFISDPFVRTLIGPAYRAEMTRRTRARAELELIEVAANVACAVTGKSLTLDELASGGFLPASIRHHPDATRYDMDSAGAYDALRGRRGAFVPIPDVEVTHLTHDEATAYDEFRMFYRRQWGRVDPVAVRFVLSERQDPVVGAPVDRLDVSVDILPFAGNAYQALQLVIGAASKRTLRPFADEVFGFDFVPGRFLATGGGGTSYVRFGVLDHEAPMLFEGDRLKLEHLRDSAGFYAILPLRKYGDREEVLFLGSPQHGNDGRFHFDLGWLDPTSRPLHGARHGDLAVVSFDPDVSARLAEELAFEESHSAQARLGLQRLDGTRLAGLLNTQHYLRSMRAARSSARFLALLYRDLKVPRQECASMARRILGADLVCPAGGRLVSSEYPVRGSAFFRSDAFPQDLGGPSDWLREARHREAALVRVLHRFRVGMRLEGQNLHSDIELELISEDAGAN